MKGVFGFLGVRGVLLIAVAGIAGAVCATSLRVSSDITHFMPRGGDALGQALSERLVQGALSRTLVIAVGTDDPTDCVEAARWLESELARNDAVERVRGGLDPDAIETLGRLYLPRRYYLASVEPESEIGAWFEPAALEDAARALKLRLAGPAATLVSRLAGDDPLLLSMKLLDRLRASGAALDLSGGRFVTADRDRSVLFVTTRASAYDARRQGPFLRDLDALGDSLRERFGPSSSLELSGIHPFAAHIERDMQRDMWKISLVSMLGVAAVFLLFFRSLRALFVCALPHVVGVLVALSIATLVFGTLTHLALLFAIALAGVSIDYSIHLLSHVALQRGPRSDMGWLRGSLTLGAVTTVASFIGLGLSTFPGFDQMGWVAAAGVATALVVSVFALPPMLAAARPRARETVPSVLSRWVEGCASRPRLLLGLSIGLLVLGAGAFGGVRWVDDVSALTKIDAGLLAEDASVRDRIHRIDLSRFVIARGADLEGALQRNDAAASTLRGLVRDGALGGFDSLHTFLWSEDLQQRNLHAFRSVEDAGRKIDEAFGAAGFRSGAFQGFRDTLADPPPPIRLADLAGTEAEPLADTQLLELPGGVAVVTFLREIRDVEALRGAIDALPGVELFDHKTFVEGIYAEYRERIVRIIVSGVFLVFAILWLRYRRLRFAIAAISPSLLTALALVVLAALSGTAVHLIHVLSLVLVMGMGVDYGIFTVDTEREEQSLGTTQMGLLVSCLTTLFVFGSLALSSYPALRAMGLTTGIGLLFSFLFAPVAVALLRVRRRA